MPGRVRACARVRLRLSVLLPLSLWWATAYLEVVVGDVVVVGLHLAERLLVVLHEVVDVKIFSFFDLVNVHL